MSHRGRTSERPFERDTGDIGDTWDEGDKGDEGDEREKMFRTLKNGPRMRNFFLLRRIPLVEKVAACVKFSRLFPEMFCIPPSPSEGDEGDEGGGGEEKEKLRQKN